jgi:molybdate transport system ATP-binding protein
MIEFSARHHFPGLDLDVSFTAAGGATVLFGPSGCGKSTVVKAIGGLIRPNAGRVAIDDVVLFDRDVFVPPERRRVGLVFQESRLFPHLSVRGNLRYGARRAPPGPVREADVVELLGIGALLDRRPHTLSGGERQRVAIGRALLSQPRLLLLDEPLASLDASRRDDILPYLARLKSALGVPLVYVTHAWDEVLALADTMVLMEAGRVCATGPLEALAGRNDLPLAGRDDAGAVLSLTVVEHDPLCRLTLLGGDGLRLLVPELRVAPGTRLRVRVPAREVILALEAPRGISLHNVIEGEVRAVAPDPARDAMLVEVAVGEVGLLARVTPDAIGRLALVPGATVLALVKSVAVDVIRSA